MRNHAEVRAVTVRNHVQPCKKSFLTGKPLKCWPHPRMVLIGITLEGWGCLMCSISWPAKDAV